MRFVAHPKRWAAILSAVLLAATLAAFGLTTPAHADLNCVNGGVYVVFARGSGETIGDDHAVMFRDKLRGHDGVGGSLASVSTAWAELGSPDVTGGEYPAIPVNDYRLGFLPWNYGDSVRKGTDALVKHLNDRVNRCPRESLVLGGYSQGADVIGWALERSGYGSLSQAARNHIGFVALYGDPRFHAGSVWERIWRQRPWWVRGDDIGVTISASIPPSLTPSYGILGWRQPYAPDEFQGRLGSWCAFEDGICSGIFPLGMNVHSTAYRGGNGWIADSANEIANKAITKRNQLNPSLARITPPGYTIAQPRLDGINWQELQALEPIPPPPPAIHSLKRTTDPDGIRQVYAATKSAITEAYWIPGGDGIHLHEIIHIAQGDIVSFDKVNLPEGKQALFAAVPDGVWECHWQAKAEVKCAKTISGLSGVTQVIVDNRWETQGYTHRLYILAGNGPHEYWWRDGDGKGIRHRLLDSIAGPVAMDKSTGPDGEDQLYVATPTWVYELWWRSGESIRHGTLLNITQGDIRSLDKGSNLPGGGQLLYTGTSTTAWQSHWGGGAGLSRGTIATSQTNALQIKKTVYNGIHQLYLATPDHVQEYYWGTQSGGGEIFRRPQHDITSFDKSNDGADQQVYTGAGDTVWETYWRGGNDPVGPVSKVLFRVER